MYSTTYATRSAFVSFGTGVMRHERGEDDDVASGCLDEDLLAGLDGAHEMIADPRVGESLSRPAGLQREAAVFPRAVRERDPELVVLVPEAAVRVVLVPRELDAPRHFPHALIPADEEARPDDPAENVDDLLLGDEVLHERASKEDVLVEREPAAVQAASALCERGTAAISCSSLEISSEEKSRRA